MRYILCVMLLIPGVIHLLPLPGVLGSEQLAGLYGLAFDDGNLAILMRHRAVLFGLLGGLLIAAAFKPCWQWPALIAGLVSAVSFVALAWSVGDYNAQIARVVIADVVASLCLLSGVVLRWWLDRRAVVSGSPAS